MDISHDDQWRGEMEKHGLLLDDLFAELDDLNDLLLGEGSVLGVGTRKQIRYSVGHLLIDAGRIFGQFVH